MFPQQMFRNNSLNYFAKIQWDAFEMMGWVRPLVQQKHYDFLYNKDEYTVVCQHLFVYLGVIGKH